MNHIYRLVWSSLSGAWVAAAETSPACGKAGTVLRATAPMLKRAAKPPLEATLPRLSLALACLLALPAHALDAAALPKGGQVTAGSASISSSGNTLQVLQNSQRAALDWQSFQIGSGATVNFVQPNSSAVALNRVLGNDASQIYGQLNANGQVFFSNPNGMLFAPGSQVNVGGLLATTLGIGNDDFMAGNYLFSKAGSGSISNAGLINAQGSIALVGKQVQNAGQLIATTVTLAAGNTVALDLSGDGLIRARVVDAALQSSIENSGSITGTAAVTLTAGQVQSALHSVVNNSGVIKATGLSMQGGEIVLQGGSVLNSGLLDVSGATGGGSIQLMGDMAQGQVSLAGTLDASAPQSGDGGSIETSAAHVKVLDGTKVRTLAANGKSGRWLIDPMDFNIGGANADISATALSSNLGGGDVQIQSSAGTQVTAGNGDINVNDAVNWSANQLTLTAQGNININANLNGGTAGKLALEYGQGAVAKGNTADYYLNNGSSISLPAGGNFSTKLGGDGATIAYTVITALGAAGSMTQTDLQGINGGLAGNYALGGDIDASGTVNWNSGSGWTPLGYYPSADRAAFSGTLAGLGHRVSNLTTVTNYDVGGRDAGFVSDNSGTLRDIGLVNVSVTGVGNYTASGGIAGGNSGTISNSYATGTVAAVSSVGGLVGKNDGTVRNSYSMAIAYGTSDVGGLVGYNTFAISNSYSTGAVTGTNDIGGLVGNNIDAISNSYSTGLVSSGSHTGGLVGLNAGSSVSSSYWNTDTSGQSSVNAVGIGLTAAQMQQASSFGGWNVASGSGSSGVWRIYAGQSNPLLRSFLTPLTVTANDASKTYDAQAYAGSKGVTYSLPVLQSLLLGSVSYVGSPTNTVNVGSYFIAPTGLYSSQQGYDISYASGTLVVSPASLTVTGLSAVSKVYDAGLSAALTGTATVTPLRGDVVSLTGTASAAFANKNVGTAKVVTTSGLSLSGSGAGNYTLLQESTTANITPATLTVVGLSATSRVYDATMVAGLTGTATVAALSGDTVTLAGTATGAFANKNVGTAKAVTTSGLSLGGADALNYTLVQESTTANITPATLTVVGLSATSRVYDATMVAGLTGTATVAALSGDTVTLAGTATGAFANKNVGTAKAVTTSGLSLGGADALNYTLVQESTTANITPATLTVSGITAANKTYDGTAFATVSATNALYGGLISGDAVSVAATGVFTDKNAALGKTVTLASSYSGADVGNYNISNQGSTTANITQLASVAWVGGSSGLWSVAANWAGGALPNASNVAAVILPQGASVTYDAATGLTQLSSLTQASSLSNLGGLTLAGGQLTLNSSLSLPSLRLNSGSLNVNGDLSSPDFFQTGGTLGGSLVNVTLASLSSMSLSSLNASKSVTLSAAGSIQGTVATSAGAPSGPDISAPQVSLSAATGIGKVGSPLKLVASALSVHTLAGPVQISNTPVAGVTISSLTTGDASDLAYMQSGQSLAISDVVSTVGGAVLIDPPTSLSMSPAASISSGGGAVVLQASSDISLSRVDAGSGSVSIASSGGAISAVTSGNNITAGSLRLAAPGSVQLAYVASSLDTSGVGGGLSVVNNSAASASVTALIASTIQPVLAPTVNAVDSVATTSTGPTNSATTAGTAASTEPTASAPADSASPANPKPAATAPAAVQTLVVGTSTVQKPASEIVQAAKPKGQQLMCRRG